MLKFGEIVLLEFPYTDLKEHKLPPAVVLKDTQDDDAIFIRITSKGKAGKFELKINDWKQAGLLKPSIIRIHKIAALQTNLIVKKIGMLTKTDKEKLNKALRIFFENNK